MVQYGIVILQLKVLVALMEKSVGERVSSYWNARY